MYTIYAKGNVLQCIVYNMKKHLFLFPNKGLEAIFNCEIKGQLSDGAWENALPGNHWYFWAKLVTGVSDNNKFEFIYEGSTQEHHSSYKNHDVVPTKRSGYNLTSLVNPKCVDLSYRMRAHYVDAQYGFNVGESIEWLTNENGVCSLESITELSKDNGYWQQKLHTIFKDKDIANFLADFRVKYDSYTRKDLIKDLRAIKAGMKQVINTFYK